MSDATQPYQLTPLRVRTNSAESGAWEQSVADSINQRARGPDSVRYVTVAELYQQTLNVISGVFAAGAPGLTLGPVPTAAEINATISALQDEIRKSLIYQTLENIIQNIDISGLSPELQEQLGQSLAAIDEERTVRVNKDNAIAAAINNIWAIVGGAQAVIQDGELASVSPSSATATKWIQVVASVTDPNTGLVNSTSIKQDLNSYANLADGTFNSIYSVRAQIAVGGQTIVGGFGFSATNGAGSTPGAQFDFGVRADRFFIAATSSTPDGSTQENQDNSIPFMVLTTPQYVNGIYYNSGVFMKRAMIGDATIGTAKIADAAITNAKIGYSISSANYDGANGWYIDKSGYAFFGNVFVRGDVRATSLSANSVTADNIVSESLSKFYRTAGPGFIDVSHGYPALCIRASCNPGMYPDGKEAAPRPNLVYVFLDSSETPAGLISVDGFVNMYDIPAGGHRIWFRKGAATGFPIFNGNINVEVIVR